MSTEAFKNAEGGVEGGADALPIRPVTEGDVSADAKEAVEAVGGEPVPAVIVDTEELGTDGEFKRVLTESELPPENPDEVLPDSFSEADIEELNRLDATPNTSKPEAVSPSPAVVNEDLVRKLAGYAQARALGKTRVKLLSLEKVREAVSASVKNLVEKKGDAGKKALSIFERAVNGVWAFRRAPAKTDEQKKQRKALMSILDQFKPVRVLAERSQAALWKIEKEMAGELDPVLKSNEAVFGVVKNFRSTGSAETDIEALKEQINDALGSTGVPDNFRGSKEKTEAFFGNILYRAMQEEQGLPERNEAKIAALRALASELKSPLLAREQK